MSPDWPNRSTPSGTTPCRATAPHLAALHNEFKDRRVVIIGLTDDDEAKVRAFVDHAVAEFDGAQSG